jgi:hypothetical protein
MEPMFLYDGECAFCSELAKFWQNQTRGHGIQFKSFHDFSDVELQSMHPSLTIDKCQGEVQLVYKSNRYPGFFAVRRMIFWSKHFRYVAPLLYLPFIPFVGMLVMYLLRKFKSNRR